MKIEIELGRPNRKVFAFVDLETEEIFIDLK